MSTDALFAGPGKHRLQVGKRSYDCEVGYGSPGGKFWGIAYDLRGNEAARTPPFDLAEDAWAFLIGRLHEEAR